MDVGDIVVLRIGNPKLKTLNCKKGVLAGTKTQGGKLVQLILSHINIHFHFFLISINRRKQEAINQHSVFSHLCDRFLTTAPLFTMKTYNVFFEVSTLLQLIRLFP